MKDGLAISTFLIFAASGVHAADEPSQSCD